MAKKRVEPRFFLNEAERILRETVKGDENFVVWRGTFPHETGWGEYKSVFQRETILVGMPDGNNPSGPPAIPVVTIYLQNDGAEIQFRVGASDDFTSSTPFNGHNPIDYVVEAAEKLSRVFQ